MKILKLILSLTLLTGCAYWPEKNKGKFELKPGEIKERINTQKETNPLPKQEKIALKNELYPVKPSYETEPAKTKTEKKSDNEKINLSFDSADIEEVVRVIMGDMLKLNYAMNPAVHGKITIKTNQDLSKAELLPTLEMLLGINNATISKVSGIYKIEPTTTSINNASLTGSREKNADAYQIKVFQIKNIAVAEMETLIKPMLKENTIINTDKNKNLMLTSGTPAELERIGEIISSFDTDTLKGKAFGMFPLVHVKPETAIKELEEIYLKNENLDSKEESHFFKFVAINRINAILAITHNANYLKSIAEWIERLDRSNSESNGGYMVYKVQHVEAKQLATTLNDFFNKGGVKKSETITSKEETATEIKEVNIENIKIMADEGNNSLLIASTAQEFEVIRPIIQQLDVMPLQVLIDATIVSVNLTDNLKYGIQWYLSHQTAGGQGIGTSGAQTSGADLGNVALAAVTGGLGYSFITGSGDIRAILSAEAKENNINVISSPSLMVLNNMSAEIQVGDEVPLRSSISTTPLSTAQQPTLTQTSGITQRKTGVKLTVKPRVNENGLVIMDIKQSVDRPVQSTTSNIDSPTIQTRTINSIVAVQSGESVVLGGLIDETDSIVETGIPFLKDIPLIGSLFGTSAKNKAKTELVVLITPRVVRNNQEAATISTEFKKKLTGIYY